MRLFGLFDLTLRPPDFVIGSLHDPYLLRWWVVPRNRFKFNIYLHRFLRSDDDRALHDHPWANVSLILWGKYKEVTPKGVFIRRAGSLTFREAEAAHRVELFPGPDGKEKPVWTLFFTGPWQRDWGFHCPKGWVFWRDFVSDTPDGNEIGKGCGD